MDSQVPCVPNGFLAEAEAFADAIATGDPDALAAHRTASLDNLATIGAIFESARTEQPVTVPA